jgi:hypothetical protein
MVIRHKWALGDTVLLTALIRDIHKAYPDKYEIGVDTHWTNVWWNNPHVTKLDSKAGPKPQLIEIGWGDAIKWNAYAKYGDRREMKHILAWYHYDFERKTGLIVPVTDPKPDLHMTDDEKIRRIQGRYWVIISGGKLDMTTKHWHAHRAQEVVDKLAAQGIHCVQVGAVHTSHIHPPLMNVTSMIGKTENVRDLWNVIMHADGVICGVTGAMHIAAAFEKPCVVYAGGREEPWFEAYVNSFKAFGPQAKPVPVEHKFLHTIGLLECCDKQGCWKKRTIPLDPGDLSRKAYTLCRMPLRPEYSHPVAKCQDLIQTDHVVEAVMDYYDQKVLPPIQPPKGTYAQPAPENGIQIPKIELVRVRAEDEQLPKPQIQPPTVMREPSVETKPQKPYQQVHPKEITQQNIGQIKRALSVMDNNIIGGRLTICVLCYGNYPELAKKCLTSILNTVPPERIDLRIGTNEIGPDTLSYLKTLPATKLYVNSTNRYKYPIMREMLWDKNTPINTNYVVWFDDDTWVVKPDWVSDLCQTIIDNHHYNYRMFGSMMYHDLSIYSKGGARPDLWFRTADWFRGRNFRVRGGQQEAVNGSVIDFAVGWCWAMATDAIRMANIPDVRLKHNGGDITIGEQMHQAGFGIKQWNKGKSLIACPTREQGGRRGYSEKFPWDPSR